MGDSSFFGGVNSGVRMPETVMNSGPLPPTEMGGMPYGLNGTPDARINYNSSLLGDIEPYAYGEPSRLSTQSSYINIPNRIQKIVPPVWVPGTSETDDRSLLTHAVDDGDVCFAMRDRFMKLVEDTKGLERMYTHRNYHPFLNLATVNYLLAGMQIAQAKPDLMPHYWKQIEMNLFGPEFEETMQFDDKKRGVAWWLAHQAFVPFGVAHGSEKQGGGHEGSDGPVTWASNFATTMYIDGHVRNLGNLWRDCDVSAGQHLVLQLRLVDVPDKYVLNHYHKAIVSKSFNAAQKKAVEETRRIEVPKTVNVEREDGKGGYYTVPKTITEEKITTASKVWQLVPDVMHSPTFELNNSFWKIAMPYVASRAYAGRGCFHDDSCMLSGALLEASFQPSFVSLVNVEDSLVYARSRDDGVLQIRIGDARNDAMDDNQQSQQYVTDAGEAFRRHGRNAGTVVADAGKAPRYDFKRFALALHERPVAVPAEAPKESTEAPKEATEAPKEASNTVGRKVAKKRVAGAVLGGGQTGGVSSALANVI